MRWPHQSAIARRDDHLARTRRLSLWIAGGAIAVSLALAAAFGFALPGHAITTRIQAPVSQGSGRTGHASGRRGSGQPGHRGGKLRPPRQAPATSASPPVVSSGGS